MGTQKQKSPNFAVTALLVMVFLVGVGLLIYPTISNVLNQLNQTRLIGIYDDESARMSEEERQAYLDAAHAYNDSLQRRGFSLTLTSAQQQVYDAVLDPFGTGMMGYIEIPKINVYVAIYHGTSDDTLANNIGHLAGTSLPVGGTSTHSVLSGHRGLVSARLFTDIDRLETGDVFMIHVLGETFTYEVDSILVVLPTEIDTLKVAEGEDLCTLMTCTPYGINTHRLLVRGHRISNAVEAAEGVGAVIIDPSLVILVAIIVAGVAAAFFVALRKRFQT